MKRGVKVSFRITQYPYEREGIVVKSCKIHSVVKVEYPNKYMLFKKKNTELKEVKQCKRVTY